MVCGSPGIPLLKDDTDLDAALTRACWRILSAVGVPFEGGFGACWGDAAAAAGRGEYPATFVAKSQTTSGTGRRCARAPSNNSLRRSAIHISVAKAIAASASDISRAKPRISGLS